MTVQINRMGTQDWQAYTAALKAGAAADRSGTRPRGAAGVNAFPQTAPDAGGGERGSRLDDKWADSVERADRIIYFWSTPIAWTVPGLGWVVPADTYTPTTTGAQNRIREALKANGVTFTETPAT